MLRNIALGLLLANILLLAWKSWVIPPDVENPARMSSGDEPQLVLLTAPAVMADAASEDVIVSVAGGLDTEAPAQARRRCVRVGPFAEIDVAESVGDQLGEADFGVRRSSKVGEIWVGYWVQLVDLKTAEKAADTVDRLINAGLVDAYIFQAEPTINISLGVFRSRKGADRVAGMARQLNLKPQMTDRFHPGVEHWLTVEIPGSREFSLSEVSLPSNRILRTEGVQCGADTIVDARIRP